MDSDGHRFRHGVDCVRLLASEANLDDAAFVFHQQPNCLPTKLPHLRKFSDPIVTLECGVRRRGRFSAPRRCCRLRDPGSLKRRCSVDVIGLRSFGVIFTVMLSVAILLARSYRGSFAAKGARNRER